MEGGKVVPVLPSEQACRAPAGREARRVGTPPLREDGHSRTGTLERDGKCFLVSVVFWLRLVT